MANGSTLEGKSQYELDKAKIRFGGTSGQNQGPCHTMNNQFINKEPGKYAYPVHIGKKGT